MDSEEYVLLFRLKVMSKLKQAPAIEFRSPENWSKYLKDWYPFSRSLYLSLCCVWGFCAVDGSEDIGKTLCGVHKAQGSVAMTEKMQEREVFSSTCWSSPECLY